ncbi:hypothetical protein [Sediminibacterium ginsengisoli]|uniref:WxcM-like, C-terminal n=1 Tax=Sediminibacterium ginsengisoli TaxID=413434 RepID=A0A1T4NWC3_9BACT|nr:hypothetical protein [Sediminibacterium ginsengisoli]SJZ83346.1 hypothetical protein SAMN04488132_10511 [Sediminibacterium ginsengisoli]
MISIIPVEKAGEDERGSTHFFENDRTGQFIVAYRKQGSASGRHYHKGLSANKNPEKIILMQGEVTLNWFNVQGEEKGTEKIKAPALIAIEPYAWHEVIAETDIMILELNSFEDGNMDTFRV